MINVLTFGLCINPFYAIGFSYTQKKNIKKLSCGTWKETGGM